MEQPGARHYHHGDGQPDQPGAQRQHPSDGGRETSGSSGNVDGTVAFNLGTVTLGSATLVNSAATITVYGSQLASGSDTITVTYSGSASYAPSSGSVTVTVAPMIAPP